ncbi:hypothetical protein BHM03_00026673 [Ensete ventricosum]|uniref:Uncharacterized protein n=1 Tax=Ensete ventricosum TaxID=4639 RepID=A0A426YCK3_ENSVE|nr:hypothetical protein B296_00052413 [Ensete ventricosum]RZR97477.1 hypothetical protein BHM03_00026673 [Ensete ventricosum]
MAESVPSVEDKSQILRAEETRILHQSSGLPSTHRETESKNGVAVGDFGGGGGSGGRGGGAADPPRPPSRQVADRCLGVAPPSAWSQYPPFRGLPVLR